MATVQPSKSKMLLAHTVRERFVIELEVALKIVAQRVHDRLIELLDEPTNARETQTRRDIWVAYKTSRTLWINGCIGRWRACLTDSANDKPSTYESDILQLVETEVEENKILASRMVLSVMEKVSGEVEDLRLRIKHLQAMDDLSEKDILRTEWVLQLMVAEWSASGMPQASWVMVSATVKAHLADALRNAYQNANALLIKHGILPTIALKDRIKGAMRKAGEAPKKAPVSPTATDVSKSAAPTLADSSPMARARQRAHGVMGQLRKLFISKEGDDFASTVQMAYSPGLASAMEEQLASSHRVQANVQSTPPNASTADVAQLADDLRKQLSNLKQRADTHSEKVTIEIVALMFQAILAEDRIPSSMRVWFARLQMPVLRVALEDPGFLSNTTHPARLLIDRMGSCVMGFDESGQHGEAMEAEIKRIVQLIEQYPDTGIKIYQVVFDEFQKFLDKFLTDQSSAQKVVSVAQLVEQKETLAIQYIIEMRNMLESMPVRADIRDFLFKVWAEVLALVTVRKGPQHPDTQMFKKVVTDLVWAASAKLNREDRARIIEDLPALLQQLRAGMTLLALSAQVQETHIKSISETLTAAFMSKTQVISKSRIDAIAKRLGHLEEFISADGMGNLQLSAESLEVMIGLDAAEIEVLTNPSQDTPEDTLEWTQELHTGQWFTLNHNQTICQVQYVWRSERQHFHMFISKANKSYLIQAGRLVAYLQSGLLVANEEETLTERAARDALAKLKANPERLLG